MGQEIPEITADIIDTIRTNYVGFASFTILIWDHIDTFSDEVEFVWKGKKNSPFIYLFFFNRYFTPLGFILNLYAYLSPVWADESRCAHFVRYEGVTVALAIEVVGLMMLLRVNALYPHHKWIGRGLSLLLIVETIMNAYLIYRGEPVVHNHESGMHACSMVFDPAISAIASSSAWIPLLYDTIIFGLTLYRTVPSIRRQEASYIVERLLEDGMLYYSVIFTVTCVLTFMIVAAPPGTKNIAAQLEQLITVAMMSRITINLKKAGDQRPIDPETYYSEGITQAPTKPLWILELARRHRRTGSFRSFWESNSFETATMTGTTSANALPSQYGGNQLDRMSFAPGPGRVPSPPLPELSMPPLHTRSKSLQTAV